MENNIQNIIKEYKKKLLALIQNLINIQSINDEIYLNNEIKKSSEYLHSLLLQKQSSLTNKNNINNKIYPSLLLVQPKPIINVIPVYTNKIKLNKDNSENKLFTINVKFYNEIGETTIIQCKPLDKVSDIIKRYRLKANDFKENRFDYNFINLNDKLNSTLIDCGIRNGDKIIVSSLRNAVV